MPDDMPYTRHVAVMMPFGGQDRIQQRRCVLEFMRIRHLIEFGINVTPRLSETNVSLKYIVRAFQASVGQIPDDALQVVANADILIGLVTEKNVNVIYELAVRNLLRDEMILVVKGDPNEVIPIYLKNMGHIRFDPPGSERVTDQIIKLAKDEFPQLSLEADTPDALKQATDRYDESLREQLQGALQTVEARPPRRPAYILNLVKDLDPGRILSSWTTFYRYGVWRIKWKRRSSKLTYDPSDLEGAPVLYYAGERCLELFNIPEKEFPDPDSDQALTTETIFDRIKNSRIVDEENFKAFEEDQNRLSREIVFENGFARAKVPLQFNSNHKAVPNRDYMPILMGKRTVGDPQRPHTTYLLVVYVRHGSRAN